MVKLQGRRGCMWFVDPVLSGTRTTQVLGSRGFPPFMSEKGTFCSWAADANYGLFCPTFLGSWGFVKCRAVIAWVPMRSLNPQAQVSFPGRQHLTCVATTCGWENEVCLL